jgi:hypothetical protein
MRTDVVAVTSATAHGAPRDSTQPALTRVAVITRHHRTHLTLVLCHPYRNLATDIDPIVEPSDSGLPYPIVLHSDLTFTAFPDQILHTLGRIDEHVLTRAGDALDDGPPASDTPPLNGPDDPRWQFKHDELDNIITLRTPSLRTLLD